MKRIVMISMLAVLTAVPSMAQYVRGRSVRPVTVTPVRRGYLEDSYRHRAGLDGYFGLRVGFGVSNVNADDHYLDGGTPKTGLNVGFVAGIQVAPATPLYLESGLSYVEKGGKNGSTTFNMNYLEVPFLMKYQHNFDRLTSIQPFAGVYCAAGVGGKIKEQDRRQTYSSFSDDAFKRFDGGLRIGCGLQFDHLYAELGYDIGLANVSHDDFNTAHTGSFFTNIGVNF
jgi:hypothetical protein